MGRNPTWGNTPIPTSTSGGNTAIGSRALNMGHSGFAMKKLEVEVEVQINSSNEVFITFKSETGEYILFKKYDKVNIESESKAIEKIIAYDGNDKTEFRTPFDYGVSKVKGRLFWDDLVNNGWQLKEN